MRNLKGAKSWFMVQRVERSEVVVRNELDNGVASGIIKWRIPEAVMAIKIASKIRDFGKEGQRRWRYVSWDVD